MYKLSWHKNIGQIILVFVGVVSKLNSAMTDET